MPALTTQQIKQAQQNSPEWQAQNLLRQKWANIFNNEQLCKQYVGAVGIKPEKGVIPIPNDPNEREIAKEAAYNVINSANPLDGHSKLIAGDDASRSVPIQVTAAKLFLRACASYVKSYDKSSNKMAKNLGKQGYGAVSQADVTPVSDGILDLKNAGSAAGKHMAYLDKANDTDGQKIFEQQINKYLNNRVYSTYYLIYYLTTVAGEDPNNTETWCKQRGYQNQTEETKRINTLRSVATQYINYENSLRPRGEPDKNTVKQQDWINKNTTTGGR